MKYAVEMGPGATITIPNFIKTGSGVQKLMGWEADPTDMQTGWRWHKPTLGKYAKRNILSVICQQFEQYCAQGSQLLTRTLSASLRQCLVKYHIRF
jgi:hypothetical protein